MGNSKNAINHTMVNGLRTINVDVNGLQSLISIYIYVQRTLYIVHIPCIAIFRIRNTKLEFWWWLNFGLLGILVDNMYTVHRTLKPCTSHWNIGEWTENILKCEKSSLLSNMKFEPLNNDFGVSTPRGWKRSAKWKLIWLTNSPSVGTMFD